MRWLFGLFLWRTGSSMLLLATFTTWWLLALAIDVVLGVVAFVVRGSVGTWWRDA